MSTKKIKDGTKSTSNITKKPVGASTKKPTREPSTDRKIAKKEEKTQPKTRTSSRLPKKPDDDDKPKKPPLRILNQTSKKARPPLKTSSRSSRPVTPPSSRITKTQFFPTKKMYSQALNSEIKTKKVASPRETSPDTSSMSERPRTATLRKGSIVNHNIVGPDAPITIKKPISESPDEYEDDFDSYESDFEECSSSDSANLISSGSTSSESESTELKSIARADDERKLDSGNYELPEFRHRQMLDNIKESIEKENSKLGQDQTRSNMASLSDEGFEDGKSLQFINFLGAQRKYQHRKSMELKRKRGEEILSMIRLDHYSFTLFDAAPVPYDVFIKSFGKSNAVQASVQTGEDDLDEEIQTEEITSHNKWTQFPPNLAMTGPTGDEFWAVYKCNYLGVGGDELERHLADNIYIEAGLERFLLSAGNLMLNIQAEENLQIRENSQTKSNIPFSRGFILCETGAQAVLKNRSIKDVSFGYHNPNKILTVHGRNDDSERSVVCLWDISDVTEPEMLLVAFGEVCCCVFNVDCPSLIFGGLLDGTLVMWDTKEASSCHKNLETEPKNVTMRSPTYSTEINNGHSGKIVSIQCLTSTSPESSLFTEHKSAEICSLDENGEIIVWGVIFKEPSPDRIVENQGLAHWGLVIITINTRISLTKLYPEIDDLKCTDMAVSHSDLYVSTNYGIIIHCLASGGKTSVKKFLPESQSGVNCLEMCPFSPQYILAGFDNGDINFYSRAIERPLMVLSNKETVEDKCKVQIIQWSYNRPLIFYTKDVTNTIHVWNLKVSDMFPIYSIPFKDNIVRMKLSAVIKSNDDALEKTYMMIATDNGAVYVHLLDDEHGQQSLQEFEGDKKKFFNYINRYV